MTEINEEIPIPLEGIEQDRPTHQPSGVQLWIDRGWVFYLWGSGVAVLLALANVVASEANLFDVIHRACNDKLLLVSIAHQCLLIVVVVMMALTKYTLSDIRETERENVIDKCRAIVIDWIIFLIFARPLHADAPASPLRLAYAMLYLLGMRILLQLLKLRTAVLADYQPTLKAMLKIVVVTTILSLINLRVVSWCYRFFHEQGVLPAELYSLSPWRSLQQAVNTLFQINDDDTYRSFLQGIFNENIVRRLTEIESVLLRPLIIFASWQTNFIRWLCPQQLAGLILMLTDYRYGAMAWFLFECLQLLLEGVLSALKALMQAFDFELQQRTHRSWRDIIVGNIVIDLLQDALSSALSVVWIVSLIIAGTNRHTYSIPIFLITDMLQNLVGFYNTALSLYRYAAMETFLSQFPKASLDDVERQDSCIVCRETLYINSGDPVKLHCGHIFHYACLKNWYTQQQSCPICRHSISSTRPSPNPNPGEPQADGDQPVAVQITTHISVPGRDAPSLLGAIGDKMDDPNTIVAFGEFTHKDNKEASYITIVIAEDERFFKDISVPHVLQTVAEAYHDNADREEISLDELKGGLTSKDADPTTSADVGTTKYPTSPDSKRGVSDVTKRPNLTPAEQTRIDELVERLSSQMADSLERLNKAQKTLDQLQSERAVGELELVAEPSS